MVLFVAILFQKLTGDNVAVDCLQYGELHAVNSGLYTL